MTPPGLSCLPLFFSRPKEIHDLLNGLHGLAGLAGPAHTARTAIDLFELLVGGEEALSDPAKILCLEKAFKFFEGVILLSLRSHGVLRGYWLKPGDHGPKFTDPQV